MVVIKKDFEEKVNKWVNILKEFEKEMPLVNSDSEMGSYFEEAHSSLLYGLRFLGMTADLLERERNMKSTISILRTDEDGLLFTADGSLMTEKHWRSIAEVADEYFKKNNGGVRSGR